MARRRPSSSITAVIGNVGTSSSTKKFPEWFAVATKVLPAASVTVMIAPSAPEPMQSSGS
jgi:hypothetical protein